MSSIPTPFDSLAAGDQSSAAPQQQGTPFDNLAASQSNQTNPGEDFKTQAWKQAGQHLINGDIGAAFDNIKSLFDTSKNPAAAQAASQMKDAAIGAGKTVAKGVGNIGDVATLGATHLIPGSQNASAGIGAKGTALNPANEDQQYGGYVGDAANFELGSQIFDSLAHLPLAERLLQSKKVLDAVQAHPVLARLAGRAATGAGEAGTGTFVATGDPEKAAEGAAVGALAVPAIEGVSSVAGKVADAVSNKTGDIASGLKNLATDIPAETESKLVDAVGDASEHAGFVRSDSSTLKDAVNDLANNFKSRAQGVYQQLDEEAPGFQELRDKIGQLKSAYKAQVNIDPTKADEIAGTLKEAESNMSDLLDAGQKARWQQADQDWSRFKALQKVQGKANRAASDLTSNELQDVDTLHTGVRSLTNATRKSNPIDILARAFPENAGDIRQIVQDGANLTSNQQAAKMFLNWLATKGAPGGAVIGGAIYGGSKLAGALSGSH